MPAASSTPAAILQARQLFHQGKTDQARALLQRYLQRDPAHREANHSLAVLLLQAGELQRAEYHARRAAIHDDPEAHATLASIFDARADHPSALASARRAAQLAATSAQSLIDLIPLFWGMGEFDDALAAAHAAMKLDPRLARGPLAHILIHIGEAESAAAMLRAELAKDPDAPDVLHPLVQALNYLPNTDPRESFTLHQRLGQTYSGFTRPPRPDQPREPEKRLRIGLISPDFYSQSVSFFAEPIIEFLDRAHFEVFCYSSTSRPDEVTRRLQSRADAWRDIANLSTAAIIELLDADGLDILIDLAGHTTGNHLAVMAARPAPIQFTAIGYPNTTGVPQIDYRLVDITTDPPESFATEQLLRLRGCFLCYRPMDRAPEIVLRRVPRACEPQVSSPPTDTCAAARTPVPSPTFGSFNVVQKLSTPAIQTWARLINSVPNSRLTLKATQFSTPSIRRRFEDRFAAAGLAADRLQLLPPIRDKSEHLALYNQIDIALDPFPYNGTTTTCEALFMGVPVITLEGKVHAARVGSSLLRAANLPDLIAQTTDDYIRIAKALAASRDHLTSLHANLRQQLLHSQLCDATAYAARLGDTLRAVWRQRCRSTK